MSVFYQLIENKVKSSKNKDKWFARAVPIGTKTIDDIAKEIESNCSLKRRDVIGVLTEFSEILAKFLQNGYRVKIKDVGVFKVGVHSKGALTPEDFKETENITSSRVLFNANMDYNKQSKKYAPTALAGATYASITRKASTTEFAKRMEAMKDTTTNP